MKSLICSLVFIFSVLISKAQLYTAPVNVNNAPANIQNTNALRSKLIVQSFVDTAAANAEGHLKFYDGALVKTTTPINALWYRVLDSTKWVQILPTGGGTGGQRAWLDGGNFNVFADGAGNAVWGTLANNGIKMTTNNTTRLLLNKGGIQASTANTVALGVDTVTKNITYSSGGGGGGLTTASNGLTATGSNVKLGGTLIENTTVAVGAYGLNINGTGSQDESYFQSGDILHSVGTANSHSFLQLSKTPNNSAYFQMLAETGQTNPILVETEAIADTVNNTGSWHTHVDKTGSYHSHINISDTGISLKAGTSSATAKGININLNGALGLGSGTDYGTSGYVLQSNGNGTSPTWVTSATAFDATVDFSVNANPNTGGTTFNPNTPQLTTKIYVSTIDGSQWTWNGSAYVIYYNVGWSVFGNAANATDFIGTTNSEDFVIKVGGGEIGRFVQSSNGIQFGNGSIASGNSSVTFGSGNTASGQSSIAMGNDNIASGANSLAIGGDVVYATADYSIGLGGQNNTASGTYSLTSGLGTKSKSYGGAVFGTYNDSTNASSSTSFNTSNRAFQIGIGTADNARSNAMTVLFNGKTGIGTTTPDSTLHAVGGFHTTGGVRFTGLLTGITDTTTYKPTGINSSGNVVAMGSWPVGSGGGSGITVGTTTITSGTSGRIPFNNAGVYGESAGLVWDNTNMQLSVTGSGATASVINIVNANSGSRAYLQWFYSGLSNNINMDPSYNWHFNLANGNDVMGIYIDNTVRTYGALVVGGGNVTVAPDASAVLEAKSTTQGVLMPRMTATQASAISSPTDGLIIYVNSTNVTFTAVGFWGRVSGAWQQF